jgi:hypothetical protein
MPHMPVSTQTLALTSITPSALPLGETHDYDPSDATSGVSFVDVDRIRQATDAGGSTITGIVATSDGDLIIVDNFGPLMLGIAHESLSSVAANRFTCPGAFGLTIAVGGSVWFVYDGPTSRWRACSVSPPPPSI